MQDTESERGGAIERKFEVAVTKGLTYDILAITAESMDEALRIAAKKEDVDKVLPESTVEYEIDEDGRRVY